jgi:peroxiredoxin
MEAATARLRASNLLTGLPKPGDLAPGFELQDETGEPVTLAELLARGPLVLSFYRGVWCPYCNADLAALNDALPRMRELGAALVAVSPQIAASSRKARRDGGLGFPILSDPGNLVAELYSLRFRLAAEVKTLYQSFGIDLPKINGEDSWTLPVPARFVIRLDGIIAYAEANPDYTTRPEPDAFLAVLDDLQRARRHAA